MKKYALIVAGGKGIRIGSEIPKQFLPLKGKPILFHTIDKFDGLVDEIILVLPESHFSLWQSLCESHSYRVKVQLVAGGESRTQSVINGLQAVTFDGIVAIHDAVRPLLTRSLIEKLFEVASQKGNAIPVLELRESLRIKSDTGNKAVNREHFLTVQTPQCFDCQSIIKAYQSSAGMQFSDDASVIDHMGGTIHLVEGEHSNIKITFKEDLLFAEMVMNAIKM